MPTGPSHLLNKKIKRQWKIRASGANAKTLRRKLKSRSYITRTTEHLSRSLIIVCWEIKSIKENKDFEI